MKCARLQPYTYDSTCTENYIIMTSPVDRCHFWGKSLSSALTLPSPRPSGLQGSTCSNSCAFLYNRRKLNDEVLDHREALRALTAYSLSLIPELSCTDYEESTKQVCFN